MRRGGRQTVDVYEAIRRMRTWGEGVDWCSHDPYDALNSPAAGVLSLRTDLGRQLLTQVVKRSPVNLRPILRIRRERNEKGIGLVAAAYARLWAAEADETARSEALRWLRWLAERRTEAEWGYHFEVGTRTSSIARHAPNTVATTFVGHALLDGYELLGDQPSGELAHDAARRLIARSLSRSQAGVYFRYHTGEPKLVHNVNMLGCGFLARVARAIGERGLLDVALEAAETTVRLQRADGSWPYAESPHGQWVDSFHTGYVLEALGECTRADGRFRYALDSGFAYWTDRLFLDDGTPMYFADRPHVHDAHTYATAVEVWLSAIDRREDALVRARQTAEMLVARLLSPAGYAFPTRGRLLTNRVAFVRWSTGPAFRALATLRFSESQPERRNPIPTIIGAS